MNIRRALTSAALATGLGAAALVVAPATQAHATWDYCASGKFCLYPEAGGVGVPFTDSTNPMWHPNLHAIGTGFGNWAGSFWNRTGAHICVYENINYNQGVGGWSVEIEPTWGDTFEAPLYKKGSSYSSINKGDTCANPNGAK